MSTVFGSNDERVLLTMLTADLNNRSHRNEVAGMHITVLAKNENFRHRYSLSFHHFSGSTDSATIFSILYRCTSSEVFSTPCSQSESDSIKS